MGFLDWLKEQWEFVTAINEAQATLSKATSLIDLNIVWDALPETTRNHKGVASRHVAMRAALKARTENEEGYLTQFMEGTLTSWLETIKKYETKDPEQAKKNLVALTADVVTVAAASAAVDIGLGMLPNSAGTASAANTKQILAWLGVGAVVAAVAHDPVKIGLLRPYQDSLEQTFRNRRPDDNALFQAYRTRELAPEKVEDLTKLDDSVMNRIETDNDRIYHEQISRWGYSVEFANALSRSATRTLSFMDLRALANVGYYDRGLSIYSLWGYGLDKVVMKPALDALQVMRDRASYSGFRSMIEPSYVDGYLSEKDLIDYWTKSGIPDDVQKWILPRMKARREAAKEKRETPPSEKERDLTLSQITQAFVDELIDRPKAVIMITALKYDATETNIILNIAELRRKTPSAAKLKRLPLADYETAYKNKILTLNQVLERMKGEYASSDIEIERQLLLIGKA